MEKVGLIDLLMGGVGGVEKLGRDSSRVLFPELLLNLVVMTCEEERSLIFLYKKPEFLHCARRYSWLVNIRKETHAARRTRTRTSH